MSHLHIPDGILPLWLWLSGWIIALALLRIASARLRTTDARRAVPLIGVVSAMMLVAMSAEIVPIAYHVNLTVVAGMLLGPWASLIAAFIVVFMLALLGHGGITVVGLGMLVIAAEMLLGNALVRLLTQLAGRPRVALMSGVATVITLALSTTLVVGIVALGGSAASARETGALDPETLRLENPFSDGVISIGLGHEHEDTDAEAVPNGHEQSEIEHDDSQPIDAHGGEAADGDAPAEHAHGSSLSVSRFAAVVYTLGPFGWLLEALVTGALIGYMARVRPSLLFGGAEDRPRYPGDEHGRR